MLGFAGLNIVVAVVLAIVRKRSGLFGLRPERKEGNEFMGAKTGQSEPIASGAPAQDTREIQPQKFAAICRPDDNAGVCLGNEE
jgi:hypothetical protein